MKIRYFSILIILFLLPISFGIPCYNESDNGLDIFTKGYIVDMTYGRTEIYDSCSGWSSIWEMYCNESGEREQIKYDCPYCDYTLGKQLLDCCIDGACVSYEDAFGNLTIYENGSYRVSLIHACNDSDGTDFFTKGTTMSEFGEVLEENCLNSNQVNEFICVINSEGIYALAPANLLCPNGCSNGACVESSEDFCVETEAGDISLFDTRINYYSRSTLIFQKSQGRNSITESCVNSTHLREYYCNGLEPYEVLYECPNGCVDGACNSSAPFCFEYDNGVNYYVFGGISNTMSDGSGGTAYDSCINLTYLNEFYCNPDFSRSMKAYECPNGCMAGACISEIVQVPVGSSAKVYTLTGEVPAITNEQISCTGCPYSGTCAPFGYRTTINSSQVYCDINNKFISQKNSNSSCSNDFECITNSCISGVCKDLTLEIEQTKTALEQILEVLNSILVFLKLR